MVLGQNNPRKFKEFSDELTIFHNHFRIFQYIIVRKKWLGLNIKTLFQTLRSTFLLASSTVENLTDNEFRRIYKIFFADQQIAWIWDVLTDE